jgi:hypothetical protein
MGTYAIDFDQGMSYEYPRFNTKNYLSSQFIHHKTITTYYDGNAILG